MPNNNTEKIVEERFSKCSKQRYPGDKKWPDEDVPTKSTNPKESQDPLPNKKNGK